MKCHIVTSRFLNLKKGVENAMWQSALDKCDSPSRL